MRYSEYENRLSKPRMERYLKSVRDNKNKALYLYRLNLKLSQEFFSLLSCLEVALRNSIDQIYTKAFGDEWLKDSVSTSGFLSQPKCYESKEVVKSKIRKMNNYSHTTLITELDFGFWRYLFSRPQYVAGGRKLMAAFPNFVSSQPHNLRPREIFSLLKAPNLLRNRIAHHEPICFLPNQAVVSTIEARRNYKLILDFYNWMGINEKLLLHGLDHITEICDRMDRL